jgi:hypothetical protein
MVSTYHAFNSYTSKRRAVVFPSCDEDFELQIRDIIAKRKSEVEMGHDVSELDRKTDAFFVQYEEYFPSSDHALIWHFYYFFNTDV